MCDSHLSAAPAPRRWPQPCYATLVGWAVLLATLTGCGAKEPIRKTRVRTAAAIDKLIEQSTPESEIDAAPEMILGRIVPLQERVWFFKAAGSRADLERNEGVLALLLSVQFAPSEYPYWILPEGWREVPSRAGRFATIYMGPGEDAPTITVSELPIPEGNLESYLAQNIIRWQGQLQVPPDQIGLRRRTFPSGIPGDTFVSIQKVAPKRGFQDLGDRFAGGASRPAAAAQDIQFQLPEGWSTAPPDQFSLLAFAATTEGKPVRTTITVLARGQASLAANINRWRGQVGLKELGDDQIADQLQKVEVSGLAGTSVELYGPEESPQQGILGAIVPDGDQWWFFKLSGDAEAVRGQQQAFADFLQSIRLPDSDAPQPKPDSGEATDATREESSDGRESAVGTKTPAINGDGTSANDVKTGEGDPGDGQ